MAVSLLLLRCQNMMKHWMMARPGLVVPCPVVTQIVKQGACVSVGDTVFRAFQKSEVVCDCVVSPSASLASRGATAPEQTTNSQRVVKM